MYGSLAWAGQGSREGEATELPLPELRGSTASTSDLIAGGHLVRVYRAKSVLGAPC